MTWELILDGYSESSYSATPRFAAARLPWFSPRRLIRQLSLGDAMNTHCLRVYFHGWP
ncbi:invasion protein [Escherichia coli]|nr:invasion protein [Escherichia coli]